MPEIDLDAILAKGNSANLQLHSDLLEEINAEFEMAELHPEVSRFEEVTLPPEFENYSQPEDAVIEPPVSCTKRVEACLRGGRSPALRNLTPARTGNSIR